MRIFPIILLLFFAVGCKNKDHVPRSVLPQKKMQVILWDMMRADQFLADYVLNKDTSLKKAVESLKYYQQIFAIHKVSEEEFEHSFSFYQSHPALLKAIMDSISTPVTVATPAVVKPDSATVLPALVNDSVIKDSNRIIADTALLKTRKRKLPGN